VECPENVFALPLSLTFTLNDVVYKGSLLKVIYQEDEDHYLREQIDHHLNRHMVPGNLSAELLKDWTDSKNQIESESFEHGYIYRRGEWHWSEITLLIILGLIFGIGLIFGTKYLKKKFCAGRADKDKTPEGEPLNKPAENATCGHRILINA
jgi:hypothetical protein